MRWLVVVLFALALFAASAAVVAADGESGPAGPPITTDGKGWCRSC